MNKLKSNQRLFLSEDLMGYADLLKTNGTLPRRVDFLLLGFSYAITNNLLPAENVKRHPLIQVDSLAEDTKLIIGIISHWYARKQSLGEPDDSGKLLELICYLGITGARKLKERWESRSKSQIQSDIGSLAFESIQEKTK